MEWKEVLVPKWNSEQPLVFTHVVLTRILGSRKAREIRARIKRQLHIWDRGMYAGLVGDVLEEGRAGEIRVGGLTSRDSMGKRQPRQRWRALDRRQTPCSSSTLAGPSPWGGLGLCQTPRASSTVVRRPQTLQ